MKSDEGFLEISDKTILIQLVNENVIPFKLMNLKKAAKLWPFFFEINKQAWEHKIYPSLRTLRLLSFKVFPVEVMSVIISEDPING